MAAAASGSVKVVRALLQNGADVNSTDLRHNHASHFAGASGHLDVSRPHNWGNVALLSGKNVHISEFYHAVASLLMSLNIFLQNCTKAFLCTSIVKNDHAVNMVFFP